MVTDVTGFTPVARVDAYCHLAGVSNQTRLDPPVITHWSASMSLHHHRRCSNLSINKWAIPIAAAMTMMLAGCDSTGRNRRNRCNRCNRCGGRNRANRCGGRNGHNRCNRCGGRNGHNGHNGHKRCGRRDGRDRPAGAAGSGMTWVQVTGTSAQAAPSTGYLADNAAHVTIQLPDALAIGDLIQVRGDGPGGWKIAQNAGQQITVGLENSTWVPNGPSANWVGVKASVDLTHWVAPAQYGPIHIVRWGKDVDRTEFDQRDLDKIRHIGGREPHRSPQRKGRKGPLPLSLSPGRRSHMDHRGFCRLLVRLGHLCGRHANHRRYYKSTKWPILGAIFARFRPDLVHGS